MVCPISILYCFVIRRIYFLLSSYVLQVLLMVFERVFLLCIIVSNIYISCTVFLLHLIYFPYNILKCDFRKETKFCWCIIEWRERMHNLIGKLRETWLHPKLRETWLHLKLRETWLHSYLHFNHYSSI